jgi:hypothetical protein
MKATGKIEEEKLKETDKKVPSPAGKTEVAKKQEKDDWEAIEDEVIRK